MSLLYAIAAIAVICGFLLVLDRRDARAQLERAADREERQALLQRIQAPSEAVFEHATREAPPVALAPPAFDDDEEYWQARSGMTKEQLAEALAREEIERAG